MSDDNVLLEDEDVSMTDVAANGTEDELKEFEASAEVTDDMLMSRACTYGDSTYCLPPGFRILRDKNEGARLRRMLIEGLTAELAFSPDFYNMITPCESMTLVSPKDSQEKSILLRYRFREAAQTRCQELKSKYHPATCLWGPQLTDDKLVEVESTLFYEMKCYKGWKHVRIQNGGDFSKVAKQIGLEVADKDKPENDTTAKIGGKTGYQSHGILVNQVPTELAEERLWELFPTAKDLWISHNYTLDVSAHALRHRYAFVEYEDDEKAQEVLEKVGEEQEVDGATLLFYNYSQVRDATILYREIEEGRKVLADNARRLLIKHVEWNLGLLQRIHDEHKSSSKPVLDDAAKHTRRELNQRLRDVCRLIVRTVTLLNEDKKRRLVVKGETFSDTEEQKTFIGSAVDKCKEILGKEAFELKTKGGPKTNNPNNPNASPAKKRFPAKADATPPTTKRPRHDFNSRPQSSSGGRGGMQNRGRGGGMQNRGRGGGMQSRGRGGGMQNRGRGGPSNHGDGMMLDRGRIPDIRAMEPMEPYPPRPQPLMRGPPLPPRGGGMGAPRGAPMHRMGGAPMSGRGDGRRYPPVERDDPLNMLETIKQGISTMTEKLHQVSTSIPNPARPRYEPGYRATPAYDPGYDKYAYDNQYNDSGYY